MSSTEAEPHTADGWGIDWRKARTWLEFAGIMLQLCLVGSMASAFSVGVAIRILPDGRWTPMFFVMFVTVLLLWVLFRGWAFKFALTVRDGEFRNSHYDALSENASKADVTAYYVWLLLTPLAVILLHGGLIELFDTEARTWSFATGMVSAIPIGSHGFPYVIERLRQTRVQGRTTADKLHGP